METAAEDARNSIFSWGGVSWDAGLWSVFDGLIGLAGWGLFGTAWGDVRNGCRRLIQFCIVVGLCILAHYVWAICWPIVSLVIAVVMTIVWILRKTVRVVGKVMYHVQRFCGGTPEAVDAEYYGPGTGNVPETSELRKFKHTASHEKWVVLKRSGDVAVFKLSSDNQTIRSSGLYVGIEPDTMRGTASLVRDLQGCDKVHLCRNESCPEDGQHFKTYGLAKKYDPEKFELAVAAQGAREAGGLLWSWAWKGSQAVRHRMADFGSESETEVSACSAHRIRWATSEGDVQLCVNPCTSPGTEQVPLLVEDEFHMGSTGNLCMTHASKYLAQRYTLKCGQTERRRLGKPTSTGLHVCWHHEPGTTSRRSRSRSRERRARGDGEEPVETDADGAPTSGESSGPAYQQLLDEIRDLKENLPKEREHKDPETSQARRKRLASRSPGVTPKSSVHRTLARLGMLDSPDGGDHRNWLEEYLERYTQGKDIGLAEDQVRRTMAEEKGIGFRELSRVLHGLGVTEQGRGQKGLTKFLTKWRADFEDDDGVVHDSPDTSCRSRSWSLVASEAQSKLSTPPGLAETPPQVVEKAGPPLTIGPPTIFGKGDRRAGAAAVTPGTDSMAALAQAIQSQTAELASLVKAQHEHTTHPQGTVKGLNRLSEEMVFIMRACDQYTVSVCPGEVGSGLANGLLSAQVGAATKLRAMGFRQRMTTRLAVGLAGPFWGSQEKYCLGAADFIQYADAELDAFAMEKNTKGAVEQRPASPTKLEDWTARVKRQNEVWRLLYGEEWRDVREHAADTLAGWHQDCPHKWPLTIVMDAWEELHWRFLEEIKELIRDIKKMAKRESLSLQELRFYALLPGPDGQAWLKLPNTFDIKNPEGWFKSELEPRIERRQERALWRLTWDGGRRDRGHPAGGTSPVAAGQTPEKGGKPLLGPKLTAEEVNRARDRAPVDRHGTLLCWSHLTHQGCANSSCQRSHEPLKGSFEQLDACVRMQLLKRGGLKRMKAENKETVEQKIKEIRASLQADKAEKMSKPKRKAGEGENPVAEEVGTGKAGGQREPRVRFWDVPVEFEAVDYTRQEDIKELVQQPDTYWGVPEPHQERPFHGGDEDAPSEAVELVKRARELHDGPVLTALNEASDDLFAWAATRVAKEPAIGLEDLLEEMEMYGPSDLAAEAAAYMEKAPPRQKAGEAPRLVVKDTLWAPGEPGQGGFELDGNAWRTWDYLEDVVMDEEMASMLGMVEPQEERRQCVTKTMAAGILARRLARRPTLDEVNEEALSLRKEQTRLALEANSQMGVAGEFVTPVEHELRVYTHDIVHPHHERDFRSFAVFPVAALDEARVVVLRADVRGRLLVETIIGGAWKPQQWTMCALIWKGHMVYAQPPDNLDLDAWLDAEDVTMTPVLGFNFFWHARHDQVVSAPGKLSCRHCRPGRKAGDIMVEPRRHSHLAAVATVAGSHDPDETTVIRGTSQEGLVLRELFAGQATLTAEWRRQGGKALAPVEVYEEPHTRTGYVKAHDLMLPENRQAHLHRARCGPENIGWVAAPCTSYCDWNLENGGSRTFQQPEGGVGRPLTDKEMAGNTLSEFAAEYFEDMLDNDGFPFAESSGASGRYPKQWDLPCWKRVLARSDVDWVEFRMCAFGLGPPDEENAYYQHLTRVVFRRNAAVRAALSRRCPGVSSSHKHVALKGSRPGSRVTRCTEAGVYCPQFVQTIVDVVRAHVVVGGVSLFTLERPIPSDRDKAGGMEESSPTSAADGECCTEDCDLDEHAEVGAEDCDLDEHGEVGASVAAAATPIPEEQHGEVGLNAAGAATSAVASACEAVSEGQFQEPGQREGEVQLPRMGQPIGTLEEMGGAWTLLRPVPRSYQPVDAVLEPSESMVATDGDELKRLEEVPTPQAAEDRYSWHEFNDANEFDEVIESYLYGTEDDPNQARLDMTFGMDHADTYGDRVHLPDGRDFYQVGEGHLVVMHVEPRRTYFVPYPGFGHEQGFGPEDLRSERLTVCKYHGRGPFQLLTVGHYQDDWRISGERNPDLGYWVGYSMFAFEGWNLPWYDEFWGSDDHDGGPEGGDPEDDNGNDEEDFQEEGEEESESETSSTSYGSQRSRSLRRAGGCRDNNPVMEKARQYVEMVNKLGNGTKSDWANVLKCGDELLATAGGVQEAAGALWEVRKEKGLDNLRGVRDQSLEGIIHPLLLEYLRSVSENGMVARHPGSSQRVESGLHPNAKAHLDQVYKQIFKDVKKHRILVVKKGNEALGNTISSPFEAVDKMLPDRSIAPDKRVVHDQRQVNMGTSKWWHPPALQPTHQQIARRVLWHKSRYPGVEVLICKRDIAGAFRLLWLAPQDAHLFAGDLPWRADMMAEEEQERTTCPETQEGAEMTVIYLVSSFGFSGSPGEWTAFGRATEEFHRAHRPEHSRRDGRAGFCSKILVDDNILVEPMVGLRPWVSARCYDEGVRLMLGNDAVNAEKNQIEGVYKEEQTIWGLNINTRTEHASLPGRRIEKGAHLLAHPSFDAESKCLTLRQLQQFRGIATGWAVVVKGLKNELKAADVFLTCGDGSMPVRPRTLGYQNEEQAVVRAWDDLWSLFEVCRWLCARPEMWEAQFGATLDELLEPRERLSLPGGHRHAVFVSADATPSTVGAIDWTGGFASQLKSEDMGPWLQLALEGEKDDEQIRIHVSEMLAFTAFAVTRGPCWKGKVVIYAGDNTVVRSWITKRQSGSRAGQLLLRVLAMCEMRYGFTVVAGWWRTFHNVDSDFVTRCTRKEFVEYLDRKGWIEVNIQEPIEQALQDTTRFGPCFLSWADPADRQLIMQLKEQRVRRSVDKAFGVDWEKMEVLEWAAQGRVVFDFLSVAKACGAAAADGGQLKLGMATIGCDVKGNQLVNYLEWAALKEVDLGVVEGPCMANWEKAEEWCKASGWWNYTEEFVTTEFGEALARRRRAMMVSKTALATDLLKNSLGRAVVATPLGTVIKPGQLWDGLTWEKPEKLVVAHGVPRDPLLPHVAAHLTWGGSKQERVNVHGHTGPGRWPLCPSESKGFEILYVYDRAGPEGCVRPLSFEEVWCAQGRSLLEWSEAVETCGGEVERAYGEGCRATGMRTAETLLMWAATASTCEKGGPHSKAGAIRDGPMDESLARLLIWLRQWKKGDFGWEGQSRKAGGGMRSMVSRHGEAIWLEALEEEGMFGEIDRKAGGRKPRSATKQMGEASLVSQPCTQPFDGDVAGKVEDWLEANLSGDKAESTARAYAGMWAKWCAWAERQQWASPYLNPKEDKLDKENKILAFLGYLGWLNFSSASLKQAVFALKDAHKRAGAGDPTEGLFRLWVLMNGLDRRAARKPRRLGVTPGMLQWIGKQFQEVPRGFGEERVDGFMVQAALLTAWFFMMRASEFCDSNGINLDNVLRGLDVKLARDGQPAVLGEATEVTVQFRKTKADQEAFGSCKTMARTGISYLCPVEALENYKRVCPARFQGADAHKPLFRWGNGVTLKRTEVQYLLQKAAVAEGLPADRFLSHSLRIGGASALFQASADIELVKRMGRWSSSSVQKYLYDGGQTLKEMAGRMAQVDKKVHYT